MKFFVMSLFPEMVDYVMNQSITGRAIKNGLFEYECVNIRDYSNDLKHQRVDDYIYGGGAGMLMMAQPIYDCYQSIKEKCTAGHRVIYTSPKGKIFNQDVALELSREKELVFLCGHYEGIDQRVLDEIVTDEYSLGDYVITGGELATLTMCDAISRLLPGVLNNPDSAPLDSISSGLLEYPQYTRPEIWMDKRVPEILLSGNHGLVDKWRLEQSLEITRNKRPDLYEKWLEKQNEC